METVISGAAPVVDPCSHFSWCDCIWYESPLVCIVYTHTHSHTDRGANYSHCTSDVLSLPRGEFKIDCSYVKDVARRLTCPPLVIITGFLPFSLCCPPPSPPHLHKWCAHMLLTRHKLFKTVIWVKWVSSPRANWDDVQRKRRSKFRQRLDPAPLVSWEGDRVCLNVLGVVCLLILESMKEQRREGGREVSLAENGIRVNDQVCPRGVVHIKAISAVTALTTWPDWLITKRCSNRNNNKCQSEWKDNGESALCVCMVWVCECVGCFIHNRKKCVLFFHE